MTNKWSDLVAKMSPERRARSAALAREMMRDLPLTELRQKRDFSQAAVAEALGVSETRAGRLEWRCNVYLSTLRRLVEAMGGELEITARFPDAEIRLGHLDVPGPGPASAH